MPIVAQNCLRVAVGLAFRIVVVVVAAAVAVGLARHHRAWYLGTAAGVVVVAGTTWPILDS